MITGERIGEYDVVVRGMGPKFAAALRSAGLKVWKLRGRIYQVSFDGHPELRAELPEVGTVYTIRE